jgi:4-amino-4-deoxy-L-arabinose transferase-like glycosyltransferase
MKISRRDSLLIGLLLALILAAAAGVRFYGLDAQSLWSDEGNSAALAMRPLAQIASDASHDIHPPLYYWLLHFWTNIFGTSEFALRSLSAVLGVLLVWATAELGRRLFGPATGLAAGFIAALAPFQVYYSQEARMYILLALEAAVSMLLFWRYVVGEARSWRSQDAPKHAHARRLVGSALLVLVWAAGLYTHYFFPVVIALQTALFFLWVWGTRAHGRAGERLLRWLLLLGLALLVFLPWALTALRQVGGWSSPADRPALMDGVAAVVSQLAVGPADLLGEAKWGPALIALLAIVGALPWPVSARARRDGEPKALHLLRLGLAPAWALVPAAAILILGLYREAYLKFLLVSSPAVALLLARAVLGPAAWLGAAGRAETPEQPPSAGVQAARAAGPLWAMATLALIGGVFGAALARYFTDPATARDDYRGIAQFIASTGHPGDTVVLNAPGQAEVFDYYYEGGLPVIPLPSQRPLNPQQTAADLEKLLAHEKVFVVYWGAAEADPTSLIERWLDTRGYKTLDQWRGNVRLAVYVMPEKRPPDEETSDLDTRFSDAIALTGYRGWNLNPKPGDVTQLQLDWEALQAPGRRYKVFLQLLDARDQVIAQRDAEPGSRATDAWQPGDAIMDNHGLLIPPGTPPGSYRRILGLYDAETLERLRLPDGSDYLSLPPIMVERAQTPPELEALEMQHNERFEFGAVSLLGHDHYKRGYHHAPETPIHPGDLLHLTFYWQANAAPRADWWFDATLNDRDGKIVAQLQAPLAGKGYSTRLWQQGEIVRGEHDLLLPVGLPPGDYRLNLKMLPDLDTEAGTAYLGAVEVSAP